MAKTIGLALSGGGSRAIAHLGAIKALQENDIKISCYSGTSAGSMVAVLIADGVAPERIMEEIKTFSMFKILKFSYRLSGFSNLKKIEKTLDKLLTQQNLEDLAVPACVIASNLNTGKVEIFEKGPIVEAVLASSSLPILFSPIKIKDSYYIDGGVLMNLPAEPLREKCDGVIGISITPVVEKTTLEYEQVHNIGFRTFELSILGNVQKSKSKCDVVIEPEELNTYGIFSFGKMDEMFEIGYRATMEKMKEIKNLFN